MPDGHQLCFLFTMSDLNISAFKCLKPNRGVVQKVTVKGRLLDVQHETKFTCAKMHDETGHILRLVGFSDGGADKLKTLKSGKLRRSSQFLRSLFESGSNCSPVGCIHVVCFCEASTATFTASDATQRTITTAPFWCAILAHY